MPIVTLMHQTGAFQHYYEAKCGIFQVRTTGSITHDQLSKQTHKQWKKTRKKNQKKKKFVESSSQFSYNSSKICCSDWHEISKELRKSSKHAHKEWIAHIGK